MWKLVNITPLPKVKQVSDPKKELRPISLTSALSKIAEDFVVSDYIKPALEEVVDPNQFGNISGSSTVLALNSMVHKWLQATDGNSATVRVFLFDYRKAFDLIDHSILVKKLKQIKVPNSITNWIIDFLSDRSQRVKLGKDCLSEWGKVPSGVPQGTKLGPWLFLLIINDLSVPNIFNMWKYIDDNTISETIPKGQQSKAQDFMDMIHDWSKTNLFEVNCDKAKELTINFSCQCPRFQRACIDGNPIESVQCAKLLGVMINSNLTWNDHIKELVKKAPRKHYFLVQLKRAQVPSDDLVEYYCTCIRSSLDYAYPVFHYALPKYVQVELEGVQKRALSCIFPGASYNDALSFAGINCMRVHHEQITNHLFQSVVNNPSNKIHNLLSKKCSNPAYNLRRHKVFDLHKTKTKRFADTFINKSSSMAIYS